MKCFLLTVLFLVMGIAAGYSATNYVTNANLAIWVPDDYGVAQDETGFVAIPTGYDFFVIVKPFNDLETYDELDVAMFDVLDKLFESYQLTEEDYGTLNGMDLWYGFFTGICEGEEVSAMMAMLDTTYGMAFYLNFGTYDAVALFADDSQSIYDSLTPIYYNEDYVSEGE